MSEQQNKLETPWIIVIVFSVVIAAQSMFIWLRVYRGRGVNVRSSGRPRTEYWELSREEPRQPTRRTGYSPAIPQPVAGVRW